MAEIVSQVDIDVKRREVNQAYAVYGFNSQEYQQGFDELHDMQMQFMADNFRKERGLPPNAKTPYCGSPWSH